MILGLLLADAVAAEPPPFVNYMRASKTPIRFPTPEELDAARRLFVASRECTGWDPSATSVQFGYTDLPDGIGGRTHVDDKTGEAWILIDEESHEALSHEVGHLWFHGGYDALSEGRAEVLGRCALRRDHVHSPYLEPSVEQDIGDLRTWHYTPGGRTGNDDDHYNGARILFAAISEVIGAEKLFGKDDVTWDILIAELRAKGALGTEIAEGIEHGAVGQRRLLSNDDRDDLPLVIEEIRGSDPDKWDTDGDGWWDGAPPIPAGAMVIFADGIYSCLPKEAFADAEMQVGYRDVDGSLTDLIVKVSPESNIYQLPEGMPNGWILVRSGRWIENHVCRSSQYGTVVAPMYGDTLAEKAMEPVLNALPKAWTDATIRLGQVPSPRRLRIELGGTETYVTSNGKRPTVRFNKEMLFMRKDWSMLARLSIAAHLVAESGRRFAIYPGATDAFVQWLYPDMKRRSYFAKTVEEGDMWTKAAAACPTGWKGLFDGTCR